MGKVINLDLILNGKENGLDGLIARVGALGNALMQAAALIDQLGSGVRDWEEGAVETYKNYETYMLEAKGALSAQYTSATQLDKVMVGLDKSAQEWASTTIFHTDDVSKAISEAAHAGWSYEQMLEGIPNAMLLAQAGNLDLSTGLDYLIKTLNGTGTAFEDSRQLVDQWTMAANSSATNIAELGEAMLRMGSTTRFADSTAEVLSLLGALADAGTVGAQAGTLLRNGMIRLIAPTDKAGAAMQILGASAEEIEEALSDQSITKAAKELDALGFSAYTDAGELKSFIEIFHDLNDATKDLSEQRKNELISAIFPTRTITGALAILDALEEIDELYEKVTESEGYAQHVADIQMSGLMGKQETFLSKWEEFSRKVGKELSGPLGDVYEWAGGIIDDLNGLDQPALSALVGGLTTLAGLGPALMITGGALKAFSILGPVGTAALAAAIGVGALVGYLKTASELNFESQFGTLNADLETLNTYVDGLDSKFKEQQEAISKWGEAVTQAQTDYENALTSFSENLLIDTLTQKKLTDDDIKQLQNLGKQIVTATFTGIENAEARDLTFLDETLGEATTPDQAEAFANAAVWIDAYYGALEDEAEAIGKRIHDKITAGLSGGFTENDRQAIQAELTRLSQINAEIANANRDAEYETQLRRASRVSWDSAEEFLKSNKQRLEESLQDIDDLYDSEYGHVKAAYNYAAAKGAKWYYVDSAGNAVTIDATPEAWQQYEQQHKEAQEAARQSEVDRFGGIAARMMDSLLSDSTAGDAWKVLKASYEKGTPFNEDGTLKDGFDLLGHDAGEIADAALALSQMWDEVGGLMQPYADNKQVAAYLDYMGQALTLWQYAGNQKAQQETASEWQGMLDDYTARTNAREAASKQEKLNGLLVEQQRLQESISFYEGKQAEYSAQVAELQKERYAEAGLDGAPKTASERKKLNATPISDELQTALDNSEGIAARLADARSALEEVQGQIDEIQGAAKEEITLTITTNAADAAAEIQAAADGPYESHVEVTYDDNGFEPKGGGEVHIPVIYDDPGAPSGSTSGGKSGSKSSGSLLGKLKNLFFEEGGRTDEPAIFGEGSTAEWAIPEEHSTRTAQLLDMTRKASGFTWPELLARTGGLNADTGGVHVTIGSYAPVIHAENANGVEKALLEDKKRLAVVVREAVNSALEERSMREAVEVYV